jgi:predicted phage terminase large subunit-like protein
MTSIALITGASGGIVQSWDTATKESELADYSVCTTWKVVGKDMYLVDVFRARLGYPELKRAVRALAERDQPQNILIEDKASGTQLIQELNQERLYAVTGVQPEGDKLMRMHAQTAKIANGFVHLPPDAPWKLDYVAEVTSFPKGKHADQVDSTSQAIRWVGHGMWSNGRGLLEYTRQEAMKMQVL